MTGAKRKICAVLGVALVLSCFTGCINKKEPSTQTVSHEEEQAAAEASTLETGEAETTTDITTTEQETETTDSPVTTAPNTTAAETILTAATTIATTAATTVAHSEQNDGHYSWIKDKLTGEKATEKATQKTSGNDFFNDVIFVGDSVTVGLKNYVTSERNKGNNCLGKSKFLCSTSLGYMNSQLSLTSKNSVHPKYDGKKVLVQDGVKLSGAKKVFVMLGMNDFSGYPAASIQKNVRKLIGQIVEESPGIAVYIESVTPIIKGKEHDKFTNANINEFNASLKSICAENGWTYVDVASCLKDSNGFLKDEYCGDKGAMGIHMSFPACARMVNYLVSNF